MKKTLVLGASLKPDRYANIAIHKLRENNHQVVAIGMKQGVVHDVTLTTEKKLFEDIDTVTLYINTTRQEAYDDYISYLHPKRFIFKTVTENHSFSAILKVHNIDYEIACTLVLLGTNQY